MTEKQTDADVVSARRHMQQAELVAQTVADERVEYAFGLRHVARRSEEWAERERQQYGTVRDQLHPRPLGAQTTVVARQEIAAEFFHRALLLDTGDDLAGSVLDGVVARRQCADAGCYADDRWSAVVPPRHVSGEA